MQDAFFPQFGVLFKIFIEDSFGYVSDSFAFGISLFISLRLWKRKERLAEVLCITILYNWLIVLLIPIYGIIIWSVPSYSSYKVALSVFWVGVFVLCQVLYPVLSFHIGKRFQTFGIAVFTFSFAFGYLAIQDAIIRPFVSRFL